jgi:hypothetical protein
MNASSVVKFFREMTSKEFAAKTRSAAAQTISAHLLFNRGAGGGAGAEVFVGELSICSGRVVEIERGHYESRAGVGASAREASAAPRGH